MPLTKTVPLDSRQITVRELIVAEIRAWFDELAGHGKPSDHAMDLLLFDDVPARDILLMSDLTADELATLAPSGISKVVDAIKEINPLFFAARAKLAAFSRRASGGDQASPSSSEASAP